ncbi:MAG: SDR family oxidoreductase [Gammaproteobacteria bacterium]|nr:SDR family oxidoreductase [Gammaproteobacteria bacterium]MBI5617359.1 SDR family oxidoreductase [Gammaproteobacteria bacterium]
MTTPRLAGKRAVVTGASTGIGRAVALACAREGAAVIVNYRNSRDAALDCVAAVRAAGGIAEAVGADVADRAAVACLVDESVALLGGIDLWANVAGADILTGGGALLDDFTKLERLIDTDLRGTMLCCWAATDALRAGRGPAIVNMSWDLALRGLEGRNPQLFAAVKAGISGFTRSLARTLAPEIRVNEVAPGFIATAFAEHDMRDDYRQWVIDSTPLKRFGTPEDVAEAVVYLGSDAASFVTGQTLRVNGGVCS